MTVIIQEINPKGLMVRKKGKAEQRQIELQDLRMLSGLSGKLNIWRRGF